LTAPDKNTCLPDVKGYLLLYDVISLAADVMELKSQRVYLLYVIASGGGTVVVAGAVRVGYESAGSSCGLWSRLLNILAYKTSSQEAVATRYRLPHPTTHVSSTALQKIQPK
jgi:hypothetical protein